MCILGYHRYVDLCSRLVSLSSYSANKRLGLGLNVGRSIICTEKGNWCLLVHCLIDYYVVVPLEIDASAQGVTEYFFGQRRGRGPCLPARCADVAHTGIVTTVRAVQQARRGGVAGRWASRSLLERELNKTVSQPRRTVVRMRLGTRDLVVLQPKLQCRSTLISA